MGGYVKFLEDVKVSLNIGYEWGILGNKNRAKCLEEGSYKFQLS